MSLILCKIVLPERIDLRGIKVGDLVLTTAANARRLESQGAMRPIPEYSNERSRVVVEATQAQRVGGRDYKAGERVVLPVPLAGLLLETRAVRLPSGGSVRLLLEPTSRRHRRDEIRLLFIEG